jgi:hypothetical protein
MCLEFEDPVVEIEFENYRFSIRRIPFPHAGSHWSNQGGTAIATTRKPEEDRPVEGLLAELLDHLGTSAHLPGGSALCKASRPTSGRIASLPC